jgi:hypothetical protein
MKVFTANGFLYAAKVAAKEHQTGQEGWTEEEIVAGMADFLAKLPPRRAGVRQRRRVRGRAEAKGPGVPRDRPANRGRLNRPRTVSPPKETDCDCDRD